MSYQKVFFLEWISRGGVGQSMTKADEGGRGVKQMLTIADEGGEGGKAIADDCWLGGEGGSENPWNWLTSYVDSP